MVEKRQEEPIAENNSSIDPISVPGIMEAMIQFQISKSCKDFFKILYRAGSHAKVCGNISLTLIH